MLKRGEMAAASGLTLVPAAQRDPRYTTTYGTGQLMKAVLDAGIRSMIIGIGGSATNDGGQIFKLPMVKRLWEWQRWLCCIMFLWCVYQGGGGTGAEDVLSHGIDGLMSSTAEPMTLEGCMKKGAELIEVATARMCRILKIGHDLHMD